MKPSFKYFFNKKVIVIFTLAAVLLTATEVTYAWLKSKDIRINLFRGDGYFETVLSENFKPDMEWKPGTRTTKEVRVHNTGTLPAFVRISLEEVLTVYETETGPGESGNTNSTLSAVSKAWLYDKIKGQLYGLDSASAMIDRSTNLLSFIHLDFGSLVIPGETAPAAPYWLYNDGYFYYSKILEPGNSTDFFLKSAEISAAAPNLMKNGNYQINLTHESIQAAEGTLSSWGITSGPVFDMLDGN